MDLKTTKLKLINRFGTHKLHKSFDFYKNNKYVNEHCHKSQNKAIFTTSTVLNVVSSKNID